MKKYLTMIAGALLITACSNDLDLANDSQSSGNAIKFKMVMAGDDGQTRAANEITPTNWDTQKFGVFAAYTGRLKYEQTTVSCDYMYNQEVKKTGGKWQYNPLKYWPNDTLEYISFYAYAPYTDKMATDDEGGIVDMSQNYDLGDPWINFRLPSRPWKTATEEANQVDLLYMQHRTGAGTTADPYKYDPWDNQSNPMKTDSTMNFVFMHALACVGDTVRIRLADELSTLVSGYATFTLDSISIVYKNLTTKARLILRTTDAFPNWKEIISGELTTTRTFTHKFTTPFDITNEAFTEDATHLAELDGSGLLYIPLQVRGTQPAIAEVHVIYTVNNGVTNYQGESVGQFAPDNEIHGKKQSIHLTLGKDIPLHHLVLEFLGIAATDPSFSRTK